MRSKISTLITVLVAILLWSALPSRAQTPDESAATQKPKAPPLSREEVDEQIKGLKEGVVTESEVIEKLTRGVSFPIDQQALDRFHEEGATDPVIQFLSKFIEKPKPTVNLELNCEPAECTININGILAGTTSGGHLTKTGLQPGELTIDFTKEGYNSDQKIITVGAQPSPPIKVTLTPTPETRLANGKALRGFMMKALGTPGDLQAMRSLNGAGSITFYAGGKQSDWEFDLATGQPHLVEMKVTGPTGSLLYRCNGGRCEPSKKPIIGGGKRLPFEVAGPLQDSLKELLRWNFTAVLEAVNASNVLSALTADPPGKAEEHLLVDMGDSTYDLTVGLDGWPSVVTYASKAGLGSGVTISFGEYTKFGDYRYPKRTMVRLGDTQHGFEIRLDRVTPGSNLRASDFPK